MLKSDEQRALKFVIRCLVAPGRGEEGHLIRQNVPYHDLISSPDSNQGPKAGATGLVDRLLKEGLLSADVDPKQGLLISVPQEALLRTWPGLWHWLSEDRHFFQMRDRLDASLKLWLSRGHHCNDLLDRGIGLAEAETLLRDFGSSLREGQIEYIRKSLAKQKWRRWVRDGIGLTAITGLAVFAAFAGVGRLNLENQRGALEAGLKKAREEKAQLAQQNANLAGQSSALETQLKKAEEKAQLAQQNADLATSQRSALETELQKAQEEKAELTQQNANLTSQSSALEAQLKNVDEKAQLAQQNADLAASQRNALQIELEKTREEKAQLEQQNANLISIEPSTSETQAKKAKGKGQRHANPTTHKRKAQQSRLKKASGKATPKNRTKKRSGSATTR